MRAIRTLKNLVITPCRSAAPAGFRHPGIGPIKKVKSRTFLLDSYPENARAAKCSIGQLDSVLCSGKKHWSGFAGEKRRA
jgi:hypothetical protein